MVFKINLLLRRSLDILPVIEPIMSNTSQKRATRNYRSRLVQRGMARFEVLGRSSDRELVRLFAKRLAEDDAEANRLRAAVSQSIAGKPPQWGGILDALRRSPLVGADAIPQRSFEPGRKVEF